MTMPSRTRRFKRIYGFKYRVHHDNPLRKPTPIYLGKVTTEGRTTGLVIRVGTYAWGFTTLPKLAG